jgi:hypothetical protein
MHISSQCSLQEEKEEEHLMGTGSDSDAEEDEDSDDGIDSEGDCFSTISIEDDAVQGEEEESLELGIDGSTEGVELRLGEIEEGSPDDVHVDMWIWILLTTSNHPKEGPLHIVHFLMDQVFFYRWILRLVVNMQVYFSSQLRLYA